MITVKLNSIEVDMARRLAYARHIENLGSRYTFEDMVGGDPVDAANLLDAATGAEIVVAKALGLYPDLTWKDWLVADLTLHNGLTLDVKYVDAPHKGLAVPVHKARRRCDIYVLVQGRLPDYEIVGHTLKEVVFLERQIKKGSPDFYLVPRTDLVEPFGPTEWRLLLMGLA